MERRIHVLNEAGLFIGQLALRMKRDAIYDIMGEELALQVGFAPHNYDSRYVALGKEAAAIVSRKMRGKHPEKMKEAQRIALAWDIMDDIEDEAQKHGIEFDKSRGYCFELMYVGEWLEQKFRR